MPAPVRGHCLFIPDDRGPIRDPIKKSPGWALMMVCFNAAALFDEPGRRYYTSHCESCRQRLRADSCALRTQSRAGMVASTKFLRWLIRIEILCSCI